MEKTPEQRLYLKLTWRRASERSEAQIPRTVRGLCPSVRRLNHVRACICRQHRSRRFRIIAGCLEQDPDPTRRRLVFRRAGRVSEDRCAQDHNQGRDANRSRRYEKRLRVNLRRWASTSSIAVI